MAKNYKTIYESGNDSIALEQRWYLVKETTRGVLKAPTGADFFFAQQGGSVTHTQAKSSNPSRSGRHHTDIIREKKSTEWSLPMLVQINTAAAQGANELDPAVAVLWESCLGKKTVASGVHFDPSTPPALTFSLFNCGDMWAEQVYGAFVMGAEISLPGEGLSQLTFNGNAKGRKLVGIAKSTSAPTGNTLELQPGEARRIPEGALVMVIKQDGTTRSTDTPDGSPRTITAQDLLNDTVTLSGAALADADGSVNPVYVVYYEPATPVAIQDPQTGLVGSVAIDLLPSLSCIRSATLSLNNNHELVNYCFGEDELSGPLFVPGARLEAMLSLEMNLNAATVEYLNRLENFEANAIDLVVGAATGRHLKISLPKVKFDVPALSVPESGSIVLSLENGMALQTALEAGDEVQVKYL